MAREKEEHQQLILGLEAQVAELQLQISTAQRVHLLQTATNEELLVGLQAKVDAIIAAPTPSKVTEAQATDAQHSLQQQLGKTLTTEWLQLHGMAGISEQSVSALLAVFTAALKDAGPAAASTLLAPTTSATTTGASDLKPATVGDRKGQLGEGASGSWADAPMGGEGELL